MRRHTGLLAGLMIGVLAAGMQPAQGYEAQPPAMELNLEGTTWDVTVFPSPEAAQHGEKSFKDTFEFQDHKVAMSTCVPKGFRPTSYSTAPIGDNRWMFKADQESMAAGKTFWNGDILEGTIHGYLIWAQPTGEIARYTLEGRRVKRAAH